MTLTNIGKTAATLRQGIRTALIIFLVRPPRLAESASARAWPSKKSRTVPIPRSKLPGILCFPHFIGAKPNCPTE
jgi:hypothetical protein